ncbi:MAG: TonB-dependent receptor [Burkholderiales bacterium]|nr:TonB-dependent receptor [Burkholderiales bacterium]
MRWLGALAAAAAGGAALAQDASGRVEVTGHYINSVGSSDAASAGTITPQLIESRPLLRPGTLLELIPGMAVTQHSGAGKANQYFLRGFNLDHGTDFATWVAGMPVNLRTHAHGQGYTDLNFVIPELISRVDYWKGPYYAQIGDFSSAGGAKMFYGDAVKQRIALATLGDYGYRRALLAGSPQLGPGALTYALEYQHSDGPWDVPSNFVKWNGLLRWAQALGDGHFGLTAMAYSGTWNATDQVPLRAIESGLIGRFGTLDASDGGISSRYSLSADYAVPLAGGEFQTTAYWFKYRLNLFSNFSFYLNDPVNGDQFEQADDRNVFGWTGEWSRRATLWGRPTLYTLGFELRQDRIKPVGLYATRQRERLSTTRLDDVVEGSAGVHASNDTRWSEGLRSIVGLRYDRYRFDVTSLSTPENSGDVSDGIWSPKLSLVFGPWAQTEYFVNAGWGFHSNDARGVTIKIDPATGDPVDPATPLVRSKGAELGLRTEAIPNLQSSLALWYLTLGSELLFIGDAGNTEAGRPSRRYGVEWSNRWRALPWLLVDLDVAWNHARFSESAPEGNYVPGAPDWVVAAGVSVPRYGPWSGAVFLRCIGSYPLTEDNSVRADAQTVVDAQVGYELAPGLQLRLDVFNLFNADTWDISYYYSSRLPGEPAAGVDDRHVHPGEPRSFRLTLSYRF